jgi:hypothetical protein
MISSPFSTEKYNTINFDILSSHYILHFTNSLVTLPMNHTYRNKWQFKLSLYLYEAPANILQHASFDEQTSSNSIFTE